MSSQSANIALADPNNGASGNMDDDGAVARFADIRFLAVYEPNADILIIYVPDTGNDQILKIEY